MGKLVSLEILTKKPSTSISGGSSNIKTKEELFDIISEYIPLKLIGERQRNFIVYLGEDLGYDWK